MPKRLFIQRIDFWPAPNGGRPSVRIERRNLYGGVSGRPRHHYPNGHRIPHLLNLINDAVNDGQFIMEYGEDGWLTIWRRV